MVPRRGLDSAFVSDFTIAACEDSASLGGTYMGRNASAAVRIAPADHELTWLAGNWHRLPREIQTTILVVAGNVIDGQSKQ